MQFDISNDIGCRNLIEVFDGSNETAPALAALVGTGRSETLTTTGNSLYIRLISAHDDAYWSPHRFNASWTADCMKELTANGNVTSVNFPGRYPTNLDCSYLITQPEGYYVSVTIVSLDLDPIQNGNCLLSDHVTVYDGGSTAFPVLGDHYCQGISLPIKLTSTRNKVLIKFWSDSNSGPSSVTGFQIKYTQAVPACSAGSIQLNRPTAEGNISSPGFPFRFPEEINCTWTINGYSDDNIKGRIELTFNTIELGPFVADQDYSSGMGCDSYTINTEVIVYEVNGNVNNVLARYCIRNGIPHKILSSGNMKIVFRSKNLNFWRWYWYSSWQNDGTVYGFHATYKQVMDSGSSASDSTKIADYIDISIDSTSLNKSDHCGSNYKIVSLPFPIPVNDHFAKYLVIFQNGKVGFSDSLSDWWMQDERMRSIYWYTDGCQMWTYDHVCGYCAKICTASDATSNILYNVYVGSTPTAVKETSLIVNLLKSPSNLFTAKVAVIISWNEVLQGNEHWNRAGETYNGTASFQVYVAANERESYAIVVHRLRLMKWKYNSEGSPNIYAGITTLDSQNFQRPKCQALPMSNTRQMLTPDTVIGNTGLQGKWVFKLGERTDTAPECLVWYNRNERFDITRFRSLPQCPCQLNQVWNQGIWIFSRSKRSANSNSTTYWDNYIECYMLSKAASEIYYPLGQECCYTTRWPDYPLVVDLRDAGSVIANNPSYLQLYQSYVKDDLLGHETCCVRTSDISLCKRYYELRPLQSCKNTSQINTRAWSLGDPHILTLDEREYIFNGWGEYIMYELDSHSTTSTLQARTGRIQLENGAHSNATVFTAFGVKEGSATVFVQLDQNTNDSFIIYGNGEDFTMRFQDDTRFLIDKVQFSLQRVNDSLRLILPSGINMEFSIGINSLAVSLAIPTTYKGLVKGLLGNYNGRKDDDFLLPNGTSLRDNLTERQIFENFAPAWLVTAQNTVLRYSQGESVGTYFHPEFVPNFLDEQSTDVLVTARQICDNNTACMYDFLSTGSRVFAFNTKAAKETADTQNMILKNSAPIIQVPAKIEVTLGNVKNFTLIASDFDGDSLTYHVEDNIYGTVLVDSSSGKVTFTPDMNSTTAPRFYARDSKGVTSLSQAVDVYLCSGCSGRGKCDFSSVIQDLSYYFHRVECVCDPAWTGDDCEQDVDGCLYNPCVEGQTCRDLSPQEQGSSVIGFDCGACPLGYGKSGPICLDIDECETSNGGCQMNCINTQGSFECNCGTGYRLNINNRSCQDLDECFEGTNDCDQLCINTQGNFQCQCVDGYNYDATRRMCIQEASLAQACRFSGCSQGCRRASPVNGTELLECFCFTGFENATEDYSECVDKNECLASVCSQRCFNLPGGFACGCYNGYRMAVDGTSCLPCTDMTYGPECQYQCGCNGHGVGCNPVTGCVCEAGWRGTQCQEEVNECMETPHVCGPDKVCLNTLGSYTCNCPAGYTEDTSGICSDIDECGRFSLLNTCEYPLICNNIPGSFFCVCRHGYSLSSDGYCEDIDECSFPVSPCQQQCENIRGSYNCDCYYGYRISSDRSSCTKVVDVCAGLNCSHGCRLTDQKSPECFCNIGFSLANDQISCNRVSTCLTAGCSHTCQIIDEKPVCECPIGMKLGDDRKTCTACPSGTYGVNCASNCSCGIGADRCNVSTGCVCRGGWTGIRCDQDVNECSTAAVQQECQAKNASCLNNPGSYQCRCNDGFATSIDGVCADINECSNIISPCGQQCYNTPGSYRCLCNKGFSFSTETKTCTDIDECAFTVSNQCDQACINTEGSYICACSQPGYVLSRDRTTCTATAICTREDCPIVNGGCVVNGSSEQCFCNSGYQLSSNGIHCNLIAVDWCTAMNPCAHSCQKTVDGTSFMCSCRAGFILNDDKRTCRENTTNPVCTRTDCPSVNGGCAEEQCFCDSGFQLNANSTCEKKESGTTPGTCSRSDCPTVNGGCRQELCFCNQGFTLSSDSSTCYPVANRGSCSSAGCEHLCSEVQGQASFTCSCVQGFVLNDDQRTCRELRKIKLVIKVDVAISETAAELANKASAAYIKLSTAVVKELNSTILPAGKGVADIRIDSLSRGSLIIEVSIWVDTIKQPDVLFSIATRLFTLANGQLTIQGQSENITYISIDSAVVKPADTACDVFDILTSCPSGQHCVVDNIQPTCKRLHDNAPATSDKALGLGLGLGIGVPLLLIGVLVVGCLCTNKKKTRRAHQTKPSNYEIPEVNREEANPYSKLYSSAQDIKTSRRPSSASSVMPSKFVYPERPVSPSDIFSKRPSSVDIECLNDEKTYQTISDDPNIFLKCTQQTAVDHQLDTRASTPDIFTVKN